MTAVYTLFAISCVVRTSSAVKHNKITRDDKPEVLPQREQPRHKKITRDEKSEVKSQNAKIESGGDVNAIAQPRPHNSVTHREINDINGGGDVNLGETQSGAKIGVATVMAREKVRGPAEALTASTVARNETGGSKEESHSGAGDHHGALARKETTSTAAGAADELLDAALVRKKKR